MRVKAVVLLAVLTACLFFPGPALSSDVIDRVITKAIVAYTEQDVRTLVSLMVERCPAYLSEKDLGIPGPLLKNLPEYYRHCSCHPTPGLEEKIEALLKWFPATYLVKTESPFKKLEGKKLILPDDPEAVVLKYAPVLSVSPCPDCPIMTCHTQYCRLPDGVRYLVLTACQARGRAWLHSIALLSPYKKDLTLFAY